VSDARDVAEPDVVDPDPNGDPLALPRCVASQEVCDGVDNDCNGLVDEVACACTQERACYLGPAQTRGVGACRDGGRACDAQGEFFQDCGGGVLPATELCADGIDNDCDGQIDEVGACVETCAAGEVRVCYTGPQETAGIGRCEFGSQQCNVEDVWNECRGALLPATEVCGDDIDNDCDGIVDTDCAEHLPLQEDLYAVSETMNRQPVDFILAIDNSGSMDDTVAQVEANLGEFAERMVDSGIDFRLALVSERGERPSNPDVCVPPPMGGPACGNTETFLHVNRGVGSNDAFRALLECHAGCEGGGYGGFLRGGSLKQVLVVTDDESDMPWRTFRDQMRPKVGNFILNGVVGTRTDGCVFQEGRIYKEGIAETGGEALHICDNDWGVVVDVIFEATVSRLVEAFRVTGVPVLDTLQVFAQEGDGPVIEQFGNWRYDRLTKLVVFLPNIGPPLGSRVVLRYRTCREGTGQPDGTCDGG
jgi:hypothetical protein